MTAPDETVEATHSTMRRRVQQLCLGSVAFVALVSCQMLSGLDELHTKTSPSTGGDGTTGGAADGSGGSGEPAGKTGGSAGTDGQTSGGRPSEPSGGNGGRTATDGGDTGGSEPTGGGDTGGSEEIGGATAGHEETGGGDTGGLEETGGDDTGGNEQTAGAAGLGSGGEATGGSEETGGSDTGGSEETGGVTTGGTGGSPTGGVATGGRATGGSPTGGTGGTGGVPTGGTEAAAGAGGSGPAFLAELTVQTGADQTALPDQELAAPVVVRLADNYGTPIVGAGVSVTAPPGAVVTPTATTSDGSGLASFTLRLSRDLGEDIFTVTAPDAAPLAVTATVVAPDDGTIFTSVNTEHTSNWFESPIAGTAARTGSLWAVEAAMDAALYLADDSRVFRLSPAGELELVAGGGSSNGEFIPATDASLWPRGLALDEDRGVLFVSNGDYTVRAVDLAEGTVWTYAGGGDPIYPSIGDGGLATDATLSNPTHLEVGPDGALFIADTGHDAVRRIDAASGVITSILSPSSDWKPGVVEFSGCGTSWGCAMVFDQAGHLFVTAYLWTGDQQTQGILRRDADGTLTHVAGDGSGSTNDGVEAKRALFTYGLTGLAIDSVGNLYVSEGDIFRVRRIDGQSSRIDTVAGHGVSGSTGDYGPATSARLNYALDLAVTLDGSLAIADAYNDAVREVWGLGGQPETPVTLSVAGGDEQSVPVDAAFSAISAHLQAAGNDVPGYAVDFRRIGSGSWLSASKATTNASGVASVTGRVGLAVGDYAFEASRLNIHGGHVPGSPVTFTVSATAPDAGTIFTVANTAHASGSFTGPCAGTVARFGSTWAIEAATDGTLYIADDSRVFKLSTAGELELFAGGGTEQGEFIPATNVAIAPRGLALDEDHGILFISDESYHTVRAVDLAAGTISTYAGGGTPSYPDIGDGGLATNASLSRPMYLKLGPDGALYISDYGHDAVRRVDAVSSVITSIVARSSVYDPGVPALYACGYYGYPCGIAFDEAGALFVNGYIWTGEQYTFGILRRDPDGTLVHIAGDNSGSTEDGVAATSALLGDTGGLAFDAAGDLWIAGRWGNIIRRIDMADGLIYTRVGDGTAGADGDYGPSTDARCYYPYDIVRHPDGHIVFADNYNCAVRMIW